MNEEFDSHAESTPAHAAFECLPMPAFVVDDDGDCVFANALAHELLADSTEPFGEHLASFFAPDSARDVERLLESAAFDERAAVDVFVQFDSDTARPRTCEIVRDMADGWHLVLVRAPEVPPGEYVASSEKRQRAIGYLSRLALGRASVSEICQLCVELIGPHLGLEVCVLYPALVEGDEEASLEVRSVWRPSDDAPIPVEVSHEEAVAFRRATPISGVPLIIDDVQHMEAGGVRSALDRARVRSAMLVGVGSRDERFGLIVGASSHPVQIGETKREFLRTVSQVLGQAIASKYNFQRLEESRQRLQLAMRLGRLSQFEWDVEFGRIEFDEQMARNLGLKDWMMPNFVDSSFDFVHEHDREDVLESVESVVRGDREEYEVYGRVQGHTGEWRWQLSRGKAVERDENGRATRILGFQQDVHDRVRAEMERAELEDQLRQSQKMEALGRLAGGIAHDFNNLLTAISGYADLVFAELEDEGLRDDMREIISATERAERLTGQLLSLSRREDLRSSVVDLNTIVAEFGSMLSRILGEDIQFSIDVEPELWHVEIDRAAVERILLNLVVNARDAMPKGGELRVFTTNWDLSPETASTVTDLHAGEYVRLSVEDTGVGMDAATRDRALEPFFTTKDVGDGSGLGLATVYGIANQAGGTVLLDSQPGEGTRVDVVFPRTHQELSEYKSDQDHDDAEPAGNEEVVIVEDDQVLLNLVLRVLRGQGYDARGFTSAREALDWFESSDDPPDLLLTDVVMPELRGNELAEQVREKFPSLSVLFMSGYTADAEFSAWAESKDVDLLRKPFTPSYLVNRIHRLISR